MSYRRTTARAIDPPHTPAPDHSQTFPFRNHCHPPTRTRTRPRTVPCSRRPATSFVPHSHTLRLSFLSKPKPRDPPHRSFCDRLRRSDPKTPIHCHSTPLPSPSPPPRPPQHPRDLLFQRISSFALRLLCCSVLPPALRPAPVPVRSPFGPACTGPARRVPPLSVAF